MIMSFDNRVFVKTEQKHFGHCSSCAFLRTDPSKEFEWQDHACNLADCSHTVRWTEVVIDEDKIVYTYDDGSTEPVPEDVELEFRRLQSHHDAAQLAEYRSQIKRLLKEIEEVTNGN